MLSKEDRIQPELVWPESYDRTPAADRESYPGDLEPTRKESFQSIADELEWWGGLDVRISTASQHYADGPNVPHQHDKPDDVGVAAYYLREGEGAENWHAIACDRWATQRENARAIALWARRQRLAERCGVTTAQSTHAASALPSGEAGEVIAVEPSSNGLSREPHEILGVTEDAPQPVVLGASRELIKEAHADQGDNPEYDADKIVKAKNEMLDA